MQTIELTQHRFEDLVQRVSRLDNNELESFFEQLNFKISGQYFLPVLAEEAILLKKIKTIIPVSVIRRFKALQAKQHDNTISEKEQEEILFVINFIEEKSVERVELLAALAKIRQVSLTELIKQIPLKNYHA